MGASDPCPPLLTQDKQATVRAAAVTAFSQMGEVGAQYADNVADALQD